jgi:hypothetical protein
MGRRKLSIEYISDDKKRMNTFKKRQRGIFKKAMQLNILTGHNITVIIQNNKYSFSEYSSKKCEDLIGEYLTCDDSGSVQKFTNDDYEEFEKVECEN